MLRLLLRGNVLFHAKKQLVECTTKTSNVVVRSFSSSTTALQLNIDSNNIISSPFPNVTGFEKIHLHEAVWEKLDKWPEKTALICSITGRSYTYKQLRKLTGRLAMALRKNKLLPGDTIAVILPNIPEFAIVALAANEAGLRATLVNPMLSTQEMRRQISDSDASLIFTIPGKYAVAKQSIEGNSNIKHPIVVVNDGSGELPTECIRFEDLVRDDIEEFSTKEKTCRDYEDTVLLPYSSGTTGFSKGVELTHRNITASMFQSISKYVCIGEEATNTHQDVVPLILPVFHIYGLVVCLYSYLRMGAKLVCMPKFSMAEFLNILKNERPTVLYVVPPIIHMMAHHEDITPDHVKTIKGIVSGAAPFGKGSVALFRTRISDTVPLVQGYGTTETSPIVTLSKDADSESVGYSVSNTQIRIVSDEDGNKKNLGMGQIGELYVKGPQVMKGYYKNPEATAETMDGDWYKTGDLASYDERGIVYIRGRLKELIKVKGFQVPPAELEEAIRGFPKVEDVAVIGVPHEQFGEIPKAFIVAKKGVSIHEDEIKDFVKQRVAKYKELGFVQFIDAIPKNAAGKILRKELQNISS